MKKLFLGTLLAAICYGCVVGWAWSWALHLDFDWWKLPIIGVVNYWLVLIANFIIKKGE